MNEVRIDPLKEPAGASNNYTRYDIPAPSLAGNLMGDETTQGIAVLLPKDYDQGTKSYPVLYFLPGFGDSYLAYGEVFSKALEELPAAIGNEMIIVCVNGRNRLNGSFYVNSPVTGNWGDFLTNDVIGYVDKNFRTIPEARCRGLAGHSMGGFGTLHTVMKNPGLFGHAYCMSPAMSNEEGIGNTMLDLDDINNKKEEYQQMSKAAGFQAYLEFLANIGWPRNVSFAYGAAFAPDAAGQPPFIALPEKNADGSFRRDAVYQKYEMGFGGHEEKLRLYQESLIKLKNFVIEYGENDKYQFIPAGSRYMSRLMKERAIKHTLVSYEGDHSDKVPERIGEVIIPFFYKAFKEEINKE